MTALTHGEAWLLRSALKRQHDHTAKQRAIDEQGLAEDPTPVLVRLAYYHETELAAIDILRAKLLPGWMQ